MSDEQIQLIQIVNLGQKRALNELFSKSKDLDVNYKDEDGNFAAVIAARHNDLDMLKLLVQRGARLDLTDGFGCTVIGWAKQHKNDEMVKYINDKLPKTSSPTFFSKNCSDHSDPSSSACSLSSQDSSPNSNKMILCS